MLLQTSVLATPVSPARQRPSPVRSLQSEKSRPAQPNSEERTPFLISCAAFLYAFSMHKYAVRNGLSSDTGIQGIIELVGMLGASLAILLATRRRPRVFGFSLPYACFAALGLLALCSSWRSFYPALSLTKAVIFLAVITAGHLVNQAGLGRLFFQSLYRWYVVSLIVGLVTGLLFPGHYPLFSVDEYSGRTTMQVFDTFFLVIGEDAALFLLLAPVIRGKIGLLSQLFLFGINILAGGKVSSALLGTLLLLRFLTGARRWQSWHAVALVVLAIALPLLGIYAYLQHGLQTDAISQSAQAIYGTKVGVEAKGLDGRLGLWLGALPLLRNVVLLGYGFEGFRDLLMQIAIWSGSSHNGYLEMALASGLVGFTCFLSALAATVYACAQAPGRTKFYLLSVASFILIDAMAGGSLHNPSFFGFLILLWLPYNRFDKTGAKPQVKANQCPGLLSQHLSPATRPGSRLL